MIRFARGQATPRSDHAPMALHEFELLYDNWHRFVYAIGLKALGDEASAEDLVQSVFTSIWKAPDAFRGGSYAAWLAVVARNRARDVLRTRNGVRETVYPHELALADAFTDDVHTTLEVVRVRSALRGLPEGQRSLIELKFFGERTHIELASMTGLPLGTVKTRIRSGLAKLRGSLIA